MSNDWRKPRIPRSERIEKMIDDVKGALTGPGDSPDESVGPFYSNRGLRRGGSGQPRGRIFGESMKIPKRRR